MPDMPLRQAVKVVIPEHHRRCIIPLKAAQQATAVIVITLQHAIRAYHRRQLPCFTVTIQPLAPFRVVHFHNLPGSITLVMPFAAQRVDIGQQLPVIIIRVVMRRAVRQSNVCHQPPVVTLIRRATTQRIGLRHQLVIHPLVSSLTAVRRALEQNIVALVALVAEYPTKSAMVMAGQGVIVVFKVTRPVAFRRSVPDGAAFFIVIVLNPGRA